MRRHIILNRATILLTGLVLLTAASACPAAETGKPEDQSRTWAKKIERPGLPNLHQVSADLYRGAQPTAEGMKELEKMGVKTIVNLRSLHSDAKLIAGTKLTYRAIPLQAWDSPSEEEMVRFLRIVGDKNHTPVFVHCQHGADRTGTMCAIYRIVVHGWTNQEALKEMTEGSFGFHSVWINLTRFLKKADLEAVKKKAAETGTKTKGSE